MQTALSLIQTRVTESISDNQSRYVKTTAELLLSFNFLFTEPSKYFTRFTIVIDHIWCFIC